jgi:hypothetical protein
VTFFCNSVWFPFMVNLGSFTSVLAVLFCIYKSVQRIERVRAFDILYTNINFDLI